MFSFALFIFSGGVIVTLALTKRREHKTHKSYLFLRLISRGDERMREFRHEALKFYSEGKDKFVFLVRKQLPLKAKSQLNKSVSLLKEKSENYIGNMRNSRLLKKQEGISEFFKSISEVEKGNGEIREEVYVPEPVVLEPVVAVQEVEAPLPKKPRAPRKKAVVVPPPPRVRKLKVVEFE